MAHAAAAKRATREEETGSTSAGSFGDAVLREKNVMTAHTQVENSQDAVPAALREAWRKNFMTPLWESPTAHKLDVERERAQHWAWKDVEPILRETAKIASPQAVERRVLSLVKRTAKDLSDESTCGQVNACYQTLLPGERARPHRHSMNALRFVVKGTGATTIVDGKRCRMEVGDLITTPAWCWHEHVHEGEAPVVWVDILDVALHLVLGTDAFEPGPVHDLPAVFDDGVFSTANIVPEVGEVQGEYSPVFRYPAEEAARALAAAPKGRDGARKVRYVNPLTGGPCMSLLDCYLMGLDVADGETVPFRSSASSICVVVEGAGTSVVGAETIEWSRGDVFTITQNDWASHRAASDAKVFITTNRDVYRRLGLLKDEYRG